MYLWTQEIETIDWNIVTFKDWQTLEIEEQNKELFTEEPTTGSELQMNWASMVAKQIVDVYHTNNVRLTDINLINSMVNDIIDAKNDEAIVEAFWKENLDTISGIFGSEEKLATISSRNIRIKDIFKS